jgi:hypothetical protein
MYHLKDQRVLNKNHESSGKLTEVESAAAAAAADGDLQIVCEITGNPINSINWFKDGIRVRDETNSFTEKYTTFRNSSKLNSRAASDHTGKKRKKIVSIHTAQTAPHKFISKLKIKNLENFDNGVYKCSVNGLDGDASKTISITGNYKITKFTHTVFMAVIQCIFFLEKSSRYKYQAAHFVGQQRVGAVAGRESVQAVEPGERWPPQREEFQASRDSGRWRAQRRELPERSAAIGGECGQQVARERLRAAWSRRALKSNPDRERESLGSRKWYVFGFWNFIFFRITSSILI